MSVDMYYLELALAVLLADRNALDGFLKATTDEARLLPDRVQIFLDGYS